LVALALLAAADTLAGEKLLFSRVWPAQEYTRVTLESAQPLRHQFFFVSNPERLVVDLEGVALAALAESDEFDALIAVGCIIRGETYHFELVANESGAAVTRVSLDHGVPIAPFSDG